MTHPARLASSLLVALALAAGAAHAAKVNSRHAEGVDFSTFETYAWRVVEENPVAPRLDSDIRGAVDEVLAGKGMRLASDGEAPDLQLEYAVGAFDQLQAGGLRLQQGWWGYLYLTPDAYSTVQGAIVVLATPHEGEGAVWAGSVVMRGNTPNALQVMRDKAGKEAERIAKTFPRGD